MNETGKASNTSNIFRYIGGTVFIGTVLIYIILSGYYHWTMKDIWSIQQDKSRLTACITELKASEATIRSSIDDLQRQQIPLEELKSQKDTLESEKRNLELQKKEDVDLQRRIDNLLNNHKALAGKIENLTEQEINLKNQVGQLNAEIASQSEKKNLQNTETLLTEKQTQLASLQKNHDELQKTIQDLMRQEKQSKENLRQISDSENKKNSLEKDILELKEDLERKKTEMTSAKKDYGSYQTMLNEIKSDHNSKSNEVKTVTEQAATLERQKNSTQNALNILQNEVKVKTQKKDELEKAVTTLKQEHIQAIDAKKEYDNYHDKLLMVKKDYENKTKELQGLKTQLAQTQTEIAINQQYLTRKEKDKNEISHEIEQLLSDHVALVQKKNELRRQSSDIITPLEKDVNDLQKRKFILEMQVKDLEQKHVNNQNSIARPSNQHHQNGAI